MRLVNPIFKVKFAKKLYFSIFQKRTICLPFAQQFVIEEDVLERQIKHTLRHNLEVKSFSPLKFNEVQYLRLLRKILIMIFKSQVSTISTLKYCASSLAAEKRVCRFVVKALYQWYTSQELWFLASTELGFLKDECPLNENVFKKKISTNWY